MKYIDNECDRQTGRSTARRLLALGYACLAAGTEVEFKDHMPNTQAQACRHRDILRNYVRVLQLPVKVTLRGSRVFVSVTPDAELSGGEAVRSDDSISGCRTVKSRCSICNGVIDSVPIKYGAKAMTSCPHCATMVMLDVEDAPNVPDDGRGIPRPSPSDCSTGVDA